MSERPTHCVYCGEPFLWFGSDARPISMCGCRMRVWNGAPSWFVIDAPSQREVIATIRAERAAREAAERECERLRRVIEGTPEARWTPGDLKDGQRFTFSSMNLGVCLRRFLEGWSIQMPRKHRGQGCYADCLTAELVCRWLNVRGAVEVKA